MINASFHVRNLLAKSTIRVRSRQVSFGALDLSLQHDQLLAQESVFQHQFRLGAGEVQGYV